MRAALQLCSPTQVERPSLCCRPTSQPICSRLQPPSAMAGRCTALRKLRGRGLAMSVVRTCMPSTCCDGAVHLYWRKGSGGGSGRMPVNGLLLEGVHQGHTVYHLLYNPWQGMPAASVMTGACCWDRISGLTCFVLQGGGLHMQMATDGALQRVQLRLHA